MIKYIEMTAHPGGLCMISAVIDTDKKLMAELVSKVRSKPDDYELTIVKKTKRRSLTANGYYWVLIEKLSKVMQLSKDECHEMLMRDYGTFATREDGSLIVFSLREDINPKEVTPYVRAIGRGAVGGKQFIHYAVLKGSHEMNSKEFSDLLDGLIYECKEQGIETLPDDEIRRLKEEYGAYLSSDKAGD